MKLILSFLFLIFISLNVDSQIQHIINPSNDKINFAEINERFNTSIVGYDDLYISHDNSTTFNKLDISSIKLNALSFNSAVIIDENTYVFVGGNIFSSGIVTTTNAGKSLELTHSQAGSFLLDVEYNGEYIIAVGEFGQILRSVDRGKTWIMNQPISNNLTSIIYNEASKEWIIGGQNVRLISKDNGLNWTIEKTNGLIKSLQFTNQKILELLVNDSVSTTNIYNNNRDLIKTFTSKSKFYNQSFIIPTGKIFSHDGYSLYTNDTINGNIYFINDSIYSDSKKQDISYINQDKTYALIVGSNGAIGKYSFNNSLTEYIPSTFNYTADNTCVKDSLTGYPTYNHAEKYEWYLDEKLISTKNKLVYKPSPGQHILSLIVYNQNNISKTSKNIVTTKPFFPKFLFSIDTLVCFNELVNLSLSNNSPSNNKTTYYYDIFDLNNNLKATNQFKNNSAQYSLGNLKEQKSIQIKVYDNCTNLDSIVNFHINVDPELESSFKIKDTVIGFCNGQIPYFKMFNTNKNLIYKVNDIEYTINDTLSLKLDQYGNKIVYLEIKSKNGCVLSRRKVAESVLSIPNVKFSFLQNCMEINDTNKVIFTKGDINRWTFSKKPDYFQNDNSNQLGILYKEKGIYEIELYTETKYNCKDSNKQKIYVSDSKSLLTTYNECSVTNNERKLNLNETNYRYLFENSKRIINTEIDSKGNIIQSGYYRYDPGYGETGQPIFLLRKLNQNGEVLWEHGPKSFEFWDTKCTAIISSKIDENDNIICLLRFTPPYRAKITDTLTYRLLYKLINYNYNLNYLKPVYFLMKFKSNGEMYFAKYLGNMWIDFSDMTISKNSIYLIGNQGGKPIFNILDTLGNNLFSNLNKPDDNHLFVITDKFSPFIKFTYRNNVAVERDYLDLSLRFEKLCDNTFVCCWYSEKSTKCLLADGKEVIIPENSKFVFTYKIGYGIINCKVLTTNMTSISTLTGTNDPPETDVVPKIEVDQNQNIYLYESQYIGYYDFFGNVNDATKYPPFSKTNSIILNDTLSNTTISNHSYVAKLNSNLETQWVNYGQSQNIKACSVINDTLYMSGFASQPPVLINNGEVYSITTPRKKTLYTFIINSLDGKVLNTSFILPKDTSKILDELYFFNKGSIIYRTIDIFPNNGLKFRNEQLRRVSFKNCNYYVPSKTTFNSCQYFVLSYKDTISYCINSEKKSFNLEVFEYQNIDSISYKIISKDSIYKEGKLSIFNNKINFETPVYLSNFKLILSKNGKDLDSIIIVNILNKPISFSYDSIMCSNNVNKVKLLSEGTITFNNSIQQNEYDYYTRLNDTSQYIHLPYKYQYLNKCEIKDSLKIKIIRSKNKYKYDTTMCTNGNARFYALPYINQHFISYYPDLEGRSNEFTLERDSVIFGLYNQGKTNFIIKTIDTNNCVFFDSIQINFQNRKKLINDEYNLQCNDSINLNPLNQYNSSFIWINSEKDTVNYINTKSTHFGDNLYSIKVSEGINCNYIVSAKVINSCKPVNLIENSLQSHFNIQPNPFTESITLHFEDEKNRTVNIYSQQGALINSIIIKNKIENINLNFLPAGVYFLNLKEDNFNSRFKIVKL